MSRGGVPVWVVAQQRDSMAAETSRLSAKDRNVSASVAQVEQAFKERLKALINPAEVYVGLNLHLMLDRL